MGLDGLPATGLTAVGLIVLLYLAQLRGLWYVKSQVDEMRKDWAERLAEARKDRDDRLAELRATYAARIAELVEERDHFREANTVLQNAQSVMLAQVEDLLDANRTAHTALQSIAREGGRGNADRSRVDT